MKSSVVKISPVRDRTPQGRGHQAEQPVQLHERRGQVGHQGSSIKLADWLSLVMVGRVISTILSCKRTLHLAFAGTDFGNTHGNPESGRRFAIAFDESLPFAEQYKASLQSETTSIKLNSASDITHAS
jgi:hypothetical protein